MGQRKEQRFGSLLPGERRARTTWLSANCEHGAAGDTLRSVPAFISAPSRWCPCLTGAATSGSWTWSSGPGPSPASPGPALTPEAASPRCPGVHDRSAGTVASFSQDGRGRGESGKRPAHASQGEFTILFCWHLVFSF